MKRQKNPERWKQNWVFKNVKDESLAKKDDWIDKAKKLIRNWQKTEIFGWNKEEIDKKVKGLFGFRGEKKRTLD